MKNEVYAEVRFNYIASHIATNIADWIRVNSFEKFKEESGFSEDEINGILMSTNKNLSLKDTAKIAVIIDKGLFVAFPELEPKPES